MWPDVVMKCSHFVSKSGQKVAKTRFYIIRNLFENFMNVWATFVRLFMAKIFYKSPDLVTLAPHTLHWQTQSSLTHADLGLCVYSNEKLFIRKWVKAIFVWPTGLVVVVSFDYLRRRLHSWGGQSSSSSSINFYCFKLFSM